MEKVCIIYNESKKETYSFYRETIDYFQSKGHKICGREEILSADIAVVIGGDGTLLRAAKQLIENKKIFTIAVNMGSLGFLTEIKKEEALDTYGRVLDGEYKLEERRVLEVDIRGKKSHALNEVVITKGGMLRKLVRVKVESSEGYVNTYRADGIIVATPTGSTAYSLSAGGPLLKPTLNAMLITPIAPHNLSTRPVVIDGNEKLILDIVEEDKTACVTIDGDKSIEVGCGDKIKVKYSDATLKLVIPEKRDYYGVLREKLKWGDGLC